DDVSDSHVTDDDFGELDVEDDHATDQDSLEAKCRSFNKYSLECRRVVQVNWIEAVILGLVQGLTEFLPISSSAHLRVVGEFLPGAAVPGAGFTAITQIGTELAVLLYFWADMTRIIAQWCRALVGKVPHSDSDVRIGWLI